MKRKIQCLAALFAFMMLAGCVFQTGDELLKAPKPTEAYAALQAELDKVRTEQKMVFAAPSSGENRNSVQLKDLDADADQEEEVIAFFRSESSDGGRGNRFLVNVYKKLGDQYLKLGSISGAGIDILSVDYPVISPDGRCGIVIAWQINTGEVTTGLTVTGLEGLQLVPALETDYIRFSLLDLTGDGKSELVTLNDDGAGRKVARMYEYGDGKMELRGEAPLAQDAKTIERMTAGYLADHSRAVFVEEKSDSGVGLMTDIFRYDASDGFRNIAPENGQNETYSTYRPVLVYATDINADGVTEVPRVSLMAGFESGSADALYLFDWYNYGGEQPALVCTTYNSTTEGWKLLVPESWHDTVTVSRVNSSYGMSATTFEAYDAANGNTPLLTVYCLTGAAMRNYSPDNGRMTTLASTGNAIFAASIPEGAAASPLSLTIDQVQQRFSMIAQNW